MKFSPTETAYLSKLVKFICLEMVFFGGAVGNHLLPRKPFRAGPKKHHEQKFASIEPRGNSLELHKIQCFEQPITSRLPGQRNAAKSLRWNGLSKTPGEMNQENLMELLNSFLKEELRYRNCAQNCSVSPPPLPKFKNSDASSESIYIYMWTSVR